MQELEEMKISQVFEKPIRQTGGAERVAHEIYKSLDAPAYALKVDVDTPYLRELGSEIERKKLSAMHSVGEWPEQLRERRDFMEAIANKDSVANSDVIITHNANASGVFDHVRCDVSMLYNHTGCRAWTFLLDEYKDAGSPLLNYARENNKGEIRNILQKQYEKPDIVVSNSNFISEKTKKYFGVESEVIHPPVNREKFRPIDVEKKDYFISVQRITWNKGLDIQFKAFEEIDEELLIIGDSAIDSEWGAYMDRLLSDLDNVHYIGKLSDEELIKKYSQAKGLISTALKEDFGLTPIEAMACGTPSIVPDEGGYKETVNKNVGIRFERSVKGLKEAVKDFNPSNYDSKELREESKLYSRKRFTEELTNLINSYKSGDI